MCEIKLTFDIIEVVIDFVNHHFNLMKHRLNF